MSDIQPRASEEMQTLVTALWHQAMACMANAPHTLHTQREKLLYAIAALESENARLQADKGRLDWLERQKNCVVTIDGFDHYLSCTTQLFREEINALAGSPKKTAEVARWPEPLNPPMRPPLGRHMTALTPEEPAP